MHELLSLCVFHGSPFISPENRSALVFTKGRVGVLMRTMLDFRRNMKTLYLLSHICTFETRFQK
jgi:hypothetical protein